MAKKRKVGGKISSSPRRYDTKYLGDEPIHDGSSRESRKAQKAKAYYWYGYFFDGPMYKAWRDKAEALGYSKSDISAMALVPHIDQTSTIKLCEMETKGWVLDDEEIKTVEKWFKSLLTKGKKIRAFNKKKDDKEAGIRKAPVKAPVPKTLTELDDLEDCWLRGEEPAFELYNRAKANGDSKGSVGSSIRKWVEARLDDMRACKASDAQALEGYSHLTSRAVSRRIRLLEAMIADIELFCASAPRVKKVRQAKVKPVDTGKLVGKLQFLKSSKDFKIESINPEAIIGAKKLYVFNTENRQLRVYTALDGGLTISGSSIRNFDETSSRETRLRKPEDMLKLVLTKKDVDVLKAWSALTTKQYTPNGRIKDTCVLLKVER